MNDSVSIFQTFKMLSTNIGVRLLTKCKETDGRCISKDVGEDRDVKMRSLIELVTAVTANLKVKNI